MKKSFKRFFVVMLTFIVVLTIVGCESKTTTSEVDGANDDFFGIDENVIDDSLNGDKTTSQSSDASNSSGGKGNQNVSNANKTGGKSWEEVLASMPKSLRGTTLKLYNWNPKTEYAGATAVIDNFEKQTGITVKWMTINFEKYTSMLSAAIASGQSPDLVRTRTTNPVALLSLQPISAAEYDFSDSAWDAGLMKDYTYNNNVYATSLKNTHLGTVNILLYNSSLIDQYDLENPYQLWKNNNWTWSKFIDICKKYKKAANAKAAVTSFSWEPWFNIYGITAPVEMHNGKFTNISCSEKFVNLAQKIATYSHTDKIFGFGSDYVDEFDKGDILFFGDSSIFSRSKNAYFSSLKEAGTLSAVPFPTIEGQNKYYVGSGEYEAYGIAKGAQNPKAAPYFLRYFLDAANYDMSNFYGNSQVLEVYNWSMKQEIIPSICFNASPWYGETYDQDYYFNLVETPSNQIKSYLESYSHINDSRVKELNKAVDLLK